MNLGSARGLSLRGLDAIEVVVEAVLLSGLPGFSIVGLADTAVSEARERLRASFAAIGVPWPNRRLTVNLSPADTAKTGTGFDLAIAAAILEAMGLHTVSRSCAMIGELGLDGSVRPVHGVLPCVLAAAQLGISEILVPAANEVEAKLVPGIRVIPIAHIAQLARFMGATEVQEAHVLGELAEAGQRSTESGARADIAAILGDRDLESLELSDVRGQDEAVWALQVAAVGMHHVQLVGPPGVGKSMLARRFPALLPPLGAKQAVQVAAIRSMLGLSVAQLPKHRPFAAPHHTASMPAIIGGGAGIARPGAITAAHLGVLFMDEFPEFSTSVIQALREPMETGWVDLRRAKSHVRYPARFQLFAAANPCRCGKAFDPGGACTCTPRELMTYRSKLGGPVRDRLDIRLALYRPRKVELAKPGIVSTQQAQSAIAQGMDRSVRRAHKELVDVSEFGPIPNAQLPSAWLKEHTPVSDELQEVFNHRLALGQISMRGVDRILRLAWSVADLGGHDLPSSDDIYTAFTLRGLEDNDG